MAERHSVGIRGDDLETARSTLEESGIPTVPAYAFFVASPPDRLKIGALAAFPDAPSPAHALVIVKEALKDLGNVTVDLVEVAVTIESAESAE